MRPAGARTWPDIAQEVRQQRDALREKTAWFERLSAQQQSLEMSRAIGTTAERWRPARRDLTAAGSLLETWHARLAAAGGQLDRRHDHRSLEKITELLYGVTITLTPTQVPMVEHRPPVVDSSAPHYSLAQVTEFIDDSLRTVESLLGEVARIRGAAERLRALRDGFGASGGGPAVPPGTLGSVDTVLEGARSDPLDVPVEAATEIELTLARLRCAQLASAINRLEAREVHSREQLVSRRNSTDVSSTPHAAASLHEELELLERRCEDEGRSDPRALAELAGRIAAADGHARRARERMCVRADCSGGALDDEGMCTRCQRAPKRGEGG